MKRRMGSAKGEITVFLSMILLCVFGLLSVMLESARTAGARCYLQIAAHSSLDSLFSQYHKDLWDEYHLFGLEYQSDLDVSERFAEYLNLYAETENWYPMEVEHIKVNEMMSLTDEGGAYVEQEILAYMKYGIWSQIDILPEEGEVMGTFLKEAQSVQELTNSYSKQSKEIWKLEQTLENIYGCLEKQRNYHAQGLELLKKKSGSKFYKQADQLEKEIKKIPNLVAAYEKQADHLKNLLIEMEGQYKERQDDLSEEMQIIMGNELSQYKSYIDEDGIRRQEIVSLKVLEEQNLKVIKETKETVAEVEAYIESIDDEDEVNWAYISRLWSQSVGRWEQFQHGNILSGGIKEEEKRNWLQQLEQLVQIDLLGMVVPTDTEISNMILNLEDAPSKTQMMTGAEIDRNLITQVLVNEYCGMHFSSFNSPVDSDGVEEKAQYELEYLLGGKDIDRDNLEEAVKKILVVREGLNLMHILMDSQKREEAKALALVITGALGMAPLVLITAFFIMAIWALGESIVDIRALLHEKKVPLIKAKSDWNLGLNQLLEMGRENTRFESEHKGKGLSYEGYLKLLLLTEEVERKYLRMMDVIQMNLKRKQEDFLLAACGYSVDITSVVCGKHVFFSLPFVENMTGSREHGYQMEVSVKKAY